MSKESQWTFFSNHAHVIICLARRPHQPLREVAYDVGITERAVQRIVSDLEAAGFLKREREGRQNHYTIRLDLPMRHKVEAGCLVEQVLGPLLKEGDSEKEA